MLIAHVKAQIAAGWPMSAPVGRDMPRARMEIRQHWRTILRQVAEKHGLTVSELTGMRRNYRAAHPRQEAMYRMRAETSLSYAAIGSRLGDRDHSTIIYGVRAHAKRTGASLPL